MQSFTYHSPTKLHFGVGAVADHMADEVASRGCKVALVVAGGGSVRRNGALDAVLKALEAAGVRAVEFSGIEPNPRVTSVDRAAALCRAEGVDLVIAVGGGSTMDASKAICAAARHDGPAWDFVLDNSLVKDALPLMTVNTIAATGSEYDNGAVISNIETNEKLPLVNDLLWHCKGSLSGIGGEIRPGIVHRIDKDTSGLLVVAKDDATHIGLSQQMAVHSVERAYQTVVYGGFAQDEGFVEANLGRSKTDRKKMAVYPAGEPHTKYAYTGYKVLERFGGFTLLECRLKTGRTHQIRVHMASIQHPVAGDPVYGPHNCITKLHGQCLHAKTLGFIHPITGEHLRFDSELPEYFTHFIASLRRGIV